MPRTETGSIETRLVQEREREGGADCPTWEWDGLSLLPSTDVHPFHWEHACEVVLQVAKLSMPTCSHQIFKAWVKDAFSKALDREMVKAWVKAVQNVY